MDDLPNTQDRRGQRLGSGGRMLYFEPRQQRMQEADGGQRTSQTSSSLNSLYSIASTNASQLASMMFSLTPTVPKTASRSRHSMTTRTLAAVSARALTTRTL